MERLTSDLIAPCGINCGICVAHLRKNNPCQGCNKVDAKSPKTRVLCRIRNCTERQVNFCYDCDQFPCEWLIRLDKRYRVKYGMSEIENLEFIRDQGIDEFIRCEREKWQSAQGILCVHDKKYYNPA